MRNIDRINCLPIKLIEPPEKLRKSSRGSLGHPAYHRIPKRTQARPSKVLVLEKCPQLP